MNARPLFFLAAAALASLAVACGSSVDKTTTSTASSTSATGSGGNDNPCWPDSCTGPSQTVGTSVTTGGAGGDNPCYPDSCTGPSVTGSGGGIPGDGVGLIVDAEQVPPLNVPGGADLASRILEVFYKPSSALTCDDATTKTFGCSQQGLSVVVPNDFSTGDYDLSTMQAFYFQWLGDCSDGGGGTAQLGPGSILSIYQSDESSVFGVVNNLYDTNGSVITEAFSFTATLCPPVF